MFNRLWIRWSQVKMPGFFSFFLFALFTVKSTPPRPSYMWKREPDNFEHCQTKIVRSALRAFGWVQRHAKKAKNKSKKKQQQQQQQTNNKNNNKSNKKNLAWTVAVWAVSFDVARVRRLQRACFQEILALTWALRLLKRVTLWSSPSAGMRCDCPSCEVLTRVVIWFMKTTWEEPRKIHLVTRLMIPATTTHYYGYSFGPNKRSAISLYGNPLIRPPRYCDQRPPFWVANRYFFINLSH